MQYHLTLVSIVCSNSDMWSLATTYVLLHSRGATDEGVGPWQGANLGPLGVPFPYYQINAVITIKYIQACKF